MSCQQCLRLEERFDRAKVNEELEHYRSHGAIETTHILAEALKAQGVSGMTLLDIGGGVGSLQYPLLKAGVSRVTSVEASSAYLEAAEDEGKRLGFIGQIRLVHGDFVVLADSVPPADIVTLDRVICCFDDMPSLVNASSARAKRFYGLVYPRATWWQRLGQLPQKLYGLFKPSSSSFQMYYHDPKLVDATVRAHELEPCFHQRVGGWQVLIYRR